MTSEYKGRTAKIRYSQPNHRRSQSARESIDETHNMSTIVSKPYEAGTDYVLPRDEKERERSVDLFMFF